MNINMIPTNTKKIVLYLLRNLDLININQISQKLDISVGSAFKILKNLEKMDIIKSDKLGNALFYQLNLDNEETIKLCELILINERRTLNAYSRIYSDEVKKFQYAELIILFGSILNSKEFNDVDVLFVTRNPKKASEFCLNLSKIRTKPIVPLILTREEFIREIENKKEVIVNILKTGVILKGDSVFMEVLKNAKK